MPSLELLSAFFVATAVFAYMPGPAMLYAAAQTIGQGRRAGWMAAAGIHIGGYVHVAAAALGLAVLFNAVPILYAVLKLAGAAYLIWLGLKLVFGKPAPLTLPSGSEARTQSGAFWQSVAVEVLNPKTAIFYVAFLPQFTDAAAVFPLWLQLFVLGTVVNVMFSSADVFCVLLADRVSEFFRKSDAAGRMARRFGGGLLVGLGVNVALDRH